MPNYQQYPMSYMPYPYSQQMPIMQMQSQQNQAQQANHNTPPMQNGGFIMVRSEEEAYRYPVASGNCVTFKVENEPIVIEKSMSFSQLDNPKIDRYRLVREEVVEEPKPIEAIEVEQSHDDGIKDELQAIRREIEGIKKKLYSTNQNQSKPVAKKREVVDDE